MIKKNFKGRCRKWKLEKCKDVMRAYSDIQAAYAERLEKGDEVKEFQCNVLLDGLEEGEYTSDFLCVKNGWGYVYMEVKADGDFMVRECVERKFLMKPRTVKLLDASKNYWLRHGVKDWGLVIDAEK